MPRLISTKVLRYSNHNSFSCLPALGIWRGDFFKSNKDNNMETEKLIENFIALMLATKAMLHTQKVYFKIPTGHPSKAGALAESRVKEVALDDLITLAEKNLPTIKGEIEGEYLALLGVVKQLRIDQKIFFNSKPGTTLRTDAIKRCKKIETVLRKRIDQTLTKYQSPREVQISLF